MSEPKRAAVSLVERDGLILCVHNTRYGGLTMPGGLQEPGETIEQAQERELREETGCSTVSRKLVFEGEHGIKIHPSRASVVCLFKVEISVEPTQQEEDCQIQWITRDVFVYTSPFGAFYKRVFAALDQRIDGSLMKYRHCGGVLHWKKLDEHEARCKR